MDLVRTNVISNAIEFSVAKLKRAVTYRDFIRCFAFESGAESNLTQIAALIFWKQISKLVRHLTGSNARFVFSSSKIHGLNRGFPLSPVI